MKKALEFLKKALDTRIKLLNDMNNPAKGYYYLHVNGSIIYAESGTRAITKEFLKEDPRIVEYWYVDSVSDFQNMVMEAKELNECVRR